LVRPASTPRTLQERRAKELASVFRAAIEKAGLRLLVDFMPLSEAAYIDREMWEKIVLNLLSNAFKFTFDGEINVMLWQTSDHFGVKLNWQLNGTEWTRRPSPVAGALASAAVGGRSQQHERILRLLRAVVLVTCVRGCDV
jgi:signal transduction histidine kinase